MRTFIISLSSLVVALLLTSFVRLPGPGEAIPSNVGTSISTFDLTLAAGVIGTPEQADAH